MRFAVVREPSEMWSVFDRLFNLPAENNGRLLVGLTHDEAKREASNTNAKLLGWRPTSAGSNVVGLGDSMRQSAM